MINYFKNLTWPKINKLLLIFLAVYFVFVLLICLFKYFTFSYNGLDLAIFNQVFYNSSLGHFFNFTIHPTSYLGDHFELIIFFLVPFYSLAKSPITLLVMQIFFLALTVVPIYLISNKYLSPLQTLLVICLYLFNPVTWNINIFEFHILALAPFFIAWTFYFYCANKFKPFLILALLSLLVREDVALVIFMFGLLAILDKKSLKWILTPITLATIYFLTALQIVAYFSSANTYKFLVYYKWLGSNLSELAINFFLKFPLVLQHVFTLANFELVLGFLLIFLFLPLLRPRYLLFSLGMLAELFLGPPGGALILKTHYGSIFLITLSLATIFALQKLSAKPKLVSFWQKNKDIIGVIVLTALVYNFLVLGPVIPLIKQIVQTDYQQVAVKNQFLKLIPPQAPIIASLDLLPLLSSRPQVYALNYTFLGKQQYGGGDYIIPDSTQFIIANQSDFLVYDLLYNNSVLAQYYEQGPANLRNLIAEHNFQIQKTSQTLVLWQKNYSASNQPLYEILDKAPKITNPQEQNFQDQLKFLGIKQEDNLTTFYFQALNKMTKNYYLQINQQIYPLGAGLFPTTAWPTEQTIGFNFFDLPQIKNAAVIDVHGALELNGLGSNIIIIDKKEVLGQLILN